MSDPNDPRDDQKRELECLRLASDLRQLAKETLDPELTAQCLRMAKQWSGEADEPANDTGVDKAWFIERHTSRQTPSVVLVVEDEPLLRMLAVEVVEEAGFIAIEARDADEAVMLLELRTISPCFSRTSTCPAAWTG